MTLTAFQKKRIIVMGGGLQWRPLVHVTDVSKAFISIIESDFKRVSGEIFNVGLNNFQIKDLAYIVREQLPFPIEIEIAPDDADKRDYNVEFIKAKEYLNFLPSVSVNEGVQEIFTALNNGKVDTGIRTVTVQWYKNIVEAKKLVESIQLNNRLI
jgi:nucleoside-diphosphate-sugar epimerase